MSLAIAQSVCRYKVNLGRRCASPPGSLFPFYIFPWPANLSALPSLSTGNKNLSYQVNADPFTPVRPIRFPRLYLPLLFMLRRHLGDDDDYGDDEDDEDDRVFTTRSGINTGEWRNTGGMPSGGNLSTPGGFCSQHYLPICQS